MTIDEKSLRDVQNKLNSTIHNLIYGGCGDPGAGELLNAANVYNVMKLLNLRVKGEDAVFKVLSGDNINEYNYLENRRAEDGNL